MQSVSDALGKLHEDGSWFARAHEVKLLVVRCSGDMRGPTLELLPMLEFHADNRSGWVVFEDAHTKEDDGWLVRASRLAEHWGHRVDAFAKEGVQLGTVGEPKPKARLSGTRAGVFRETSVEVLKAMSPPLEGMVYVLAPTVVGDPVDFETDLTEIVGAPEQARARFVVVLDASVVPPRRLLEALGARAIGCDVIVDDAQQRKDLDALVASGESPAFGMAGPPGVTPPKRVDDPPPLPPEERDAELKKAGIDPAFMDEAPTLRNCVLGAAVAMKDKRGPDAVRLQRQARDIAARLDLKEIRVICQITLASYLSGLEQRDLAKRELQEASKFSEEHEMYQPQSQAELALGLLHALDGEQREAAAAYSRAGNAAEAAESTVIAIECWRLAGQLAMEVGQQPQAIQCFQRAVNLAEGAGPDVASQSSAPEAARRLADVCRKRGLHPQAQALEAQADRFEAGEAADDAPAPA